MPDPDAELLKVDPDAPLTDIKRAYRKAALAHHPDHSAHPEAARHFRRITEAYRALEARALVREPVRQRQIPLGDRVSFLVGDLRSMVRRWPADRWAAPAYGLPAVVWVASALEVLARAWPGVPVPPPVTPTVGGIIEALEAWDVRLADAPIPPDLSRVSSRALEEAVAAAESRIRALQAVSPARRPGSK